MKKKLSELKTLFSRSRDDMTLKPFVVEPPIRFILTLHASSCSSPPAHKNPLCRWNFLPSLVVLKLSTHRSRSHSGTLTFFNTPGYRGRSKLSVPHPDTRQSVQCRGTTVLCGSGGRQTGLI